MAGVLLVSILALLHRSHFRAYGFFVFLFAGAGLVVAYRHVSLYSLPPGQLSSCGGSLSYLLKTLPLKEALLALWRGGSDCTAESSRWLSLTIPEWSMVSFGVIVLFGLVSMRLKNIR